MRTRVGRRMPSEDLFGSEKIIGTNGALTTHVRLSSIKVSTAYADFLSQWFGGKSTDSPRIVITMFVTQIVSYMWRKTLCNANKVYVYTKRLEGLNNFAYWRQHGAYGRLNKWGCAELMASRAGEARLNLTLAQSQRQLQANYKRRLSEYYTIPETINRDRWVTAGNVKNNVVRAFVSHGLPVALARSQGVIGKLSDCWVIPRLREMNERSFPVTRSSAS